MSSPGEGWGQVLQGTGGVAGCAAGGQSHTCSNSPFVLNCTKVVHVNVAAVEIEITAFHS